MTDDFQLFQDQGGGDPVDADVALITAYLARELSLVQIVAVEDRLAKDKAFRDKVRPIIDAWTMPVPLSPVVTPALSRDEVEAGWQRYVGEHAELDAHDGPRLLVEGQHPKRRKISMTRIAAGIAAITLPIITLAQVAVYAAKHPDAPGHSVAKQMVAPFVEPPPAPEPRKPEPPLKSPVDVRVGRQLDNPKPAVQRAGEVKVPAAETPTPAAAPLVAAIPAYVANPDRAKIAGLANKYLPQVVRGDTNASYIVMVMDAADNYAWSTFGNGSLQIAIGGDKRTIADRSASNRENALEYSGFTSGGSVALGAGGGSRGGGGVAAGAIAGGGGGAVMRARPGGGFADTAVVRRSDSTNTVTVLGVGDTASRSEATLTRSRAVPIAGGGGGGGVASGAMVARGSFYGAADSSGVYTVGLSRFINGQLVDLNQAAGLQEPGRGESGIQGLKATSLTMGETYLFGPGQLAQRPLRIVVVHLAPGTAWKGR
jgi:hypothetical protein